jgi:isoaspartyl peptidase/L-asparaginase-like protein (Ntn-hydrolase superfamily)
MLLISTWSFGLRGHASAWPPLAAGGSSLDAVEEVCRVVEADPTVDSVGIGGVPDRDGGMSLDGSIMVSPARCGSVAAVRRHLHVVSIARLVMDRTDHVLLAGEGADAFAEEEGLEPVATLVSDEARRRWLEKTGLGERPVDSGDGGALFGGAEEGHDTVGTLAIDAKGALAGACSTSGTPFKRPGRVGDSPIIGHGLYVHPQRGGATATGEGELVMGGCGSFMAVELMARGATPVEALTEVLERITRDHELRPGHQVGMIAVAPDGRFGSAALRDDFKVSITTADRHVLLPTR